MFGIQPRQGTNRYRYLGRECTSTNLDTRTHRSDLLPPDSKVNGPRPVPTGRRGPLRYHDGGSAHPKHTFHFRHNLTYALMHLQERQGQKVPEDYPDHRNDHTGASPPERSTFLPARDQASAASLRTNSHPRGHFPLVKKD